MVTGQFEHPDVLTGQRPAAEGRVADVVLERRRGEAEAFRQDVDGRVRPRLRGLPAEVGPREHQRHPEGQHRHPAGGEWPVSGPDESEVETSHAYLH
ncbi:hypothetical protein ACFQZ4_17535 [Catellatospora coxensis]